MSVIIKGVTSSGEELPLRINANGEIVLSLAASTSNIGDVDVLTLPPIPAGTNVIGTTNGQALSGTVLNVASVAITATTPSADLLVGTYKELSLDVDITTVTGTSPTYVLSVERKGADGVYYPIYTSTSQTAAGKISITLGVGASTNVGFGDVIRVVETLGGTTPSFTRSISIKGK